MQDPFDELNDQYNRFVPDTATQQKIEECHQQLIRSLEKPERKLVLRITVFLLAGTVPQRLPAESPAAPHIRPVCTLTQEVRVIPHPKPQTDCAPDIPPIDEDIFGNADTVADTQCAQCISKPEPAADIVPQEANSTAPARQGKHPNESTSSPKESAPHMGDTRVVDGKKLCRNYRNNLTP